MPKMPGSKQMLMRTGALILNLVGIILAIVFIGTGIQLLGHTMAMITGPIVLLLLTIFFLKAEYDFVDDHRGLLLAVSLIIGLGIDVAIGYSLITTRVNWVLWMFYAPVHIALFAMILSWHYTLTIYKKELQRHLGGYFIFLGVFLGFGVIFIGLLVLIPVVLITFAIILNQYAIIELTQQGMLKLID